MLLTSWLYGWSGRARMLRSDWPPPARRRRRRDNVLAWVETLETRQLLTVNVFFNSVSGTLHVDTSAADNITITLSSDGSDTVLVNGVPVNNAGQNLLATDPKLNNLDVLATGNFSNVITLSSVTVSSFTSLTGVTVSAGDGPDTINGSEFSDLLLGGDGDDTYSFSGPFGADTVSDSQGSDALDLQSVSGNLLADLKSQLITTGSSSVAFSITEIEKIQSGSGTDTLQGLDAPSIWQLNTIASYVGGPANLSFSDFEVLQGGANTDQFGINQNTTFTLKGGAGDDRFELLGGAQAGTLDGEGGSDTLSYATFTTPVVVDLSQPSATNVSSLSQVENVIGGANDDTLIGDSNKNLLDGRVGNDTLNGGGGFDFLRGGDGDDLLRNGIDSDGQVGNDLIVIDTSLDTRSVTTILLAAETIQVGADLKTDGGMISLTGDVVLTAASVLIDTETGNDSTPGSVKFSGGTIRAQSTNNDLTIDTSTKGSAPAGTVTLTTFDNGGGSAPKIHDLTVNATSSLGSNADLNLGAGIDVSNAVMISAGAIIVDRPVTAGGDITLAARGAAGDLTVNEDSFGGNLSVRSSGGNLVLTADRTVAIHEDISTTNSGTIAVTGGRNILLDNAAQLLADNGGITLTANQSPGVAGNFVGIQVSRASVSSSNGPVILNGRGGDTGDFNVGVRVDSSGRLTGSGFVAVTGFGQGDGSSNVGVWLESNGTITSSSGDVQILGTGSVTSIAGNSNNGVRIITGGAITAGGTGQVIVDGFGGSGTGGFNEGVHVEGSGSSISSGGGDVFVTGLEGLNDSGLAITLTNSGSISTVTNGGNVTVRGNSMMIASSAVISTNASGAATLRPQASNVGINLGATNDSFGGPLGLSDAELDRVTAGMIQIGGVGADGSSGGPIVITDTIDRSSATNFTLTVGGSNGIAFNGPNAILNSGNGSVGLSLTAGGTGAITSGDALTDIVANSIWLASGSGGIGAIDNPLTTNASTLTARTQGDAPMFLSEFDSLALTATSLSAGAGAIHLTSGVFRLNGPDQIDDASLLVIKPGATFALNGFDETLGGLSGDGSVINGSTTSATLMIAGAGDELFAGKLGGSGTDDNNFGLRKSGDRTLTLSGTNTYLGSTMVMAGTLVLNGSITSDVLVQGSGTLAGSGTIASSYTLTIGDGGTLAPGNSPGIVNSGSVTFGGGSNFNVELNGPADARAVGGHDQLNVTGTVDLSGSTLNPRLGYSPAPGDTFVIIKNDDRDPITTTFFGLPQDSLLTMGEKPFHIVYDFNSGDGNKNDVALIANRLPVLNGQNFAVDGTATAGTTIGTVVATDADSAVSFAITAGNSSGTFALDGNSGQLTVNDPTGLANGSSFSLTVTVTDDADATATATITIAVRGSAPTALSDADTTNSNRNDGLVPEGAIPGTRVGISLLATDPQGDDVFYRLTDDAGGRFTIDPLTGVVTVKTSYLLNFADATEHTIRAQAVDANGNASPEATFGIDVVEVPADALPIASILPSRVIVVEGDPTDPGHKFISFLVKLNKPSDETVQIDFSTRVGEEFGLKLPEGIPADASFATDVPGPWDFFRSAGRLTFDPGVTEQTVRVQLRPDDDPAEVNELFFVQLNLSKDVPANVRLSAGQSIAVAEILEDDSVPQVIIENTQVLEGAAPGQKELVFRLNLIGTFALGLMEATVDYSTGNIAIDTATAGIDYTSVSGTLTFTDNNRLQEVRIPITGDTNPLEIDETVSLRFTNAVGLGLSRNFAVGTIVNDDSPNVVVSLTPPVSKIREGHSGTQQVELFVTLIGQPTTDVTVNYATANHHATDGTDYVAVDNTVTFTLADIAAGISQKSIFVTVNGDTDIEPDEGFSVSLSLPTTPPNVSLDPDKTLARLVIRNDDQAVLTEDGDALFAELLADLTSILNAGGGAKNNPALVAEMQRRAELIAQSLGLTRAILLIIDPVDFVLTDPGDRQSGYTENTGSVNQIPGTYYSGDGTVELLIVPLPPDGTYNVQLAGLGGDFNASVTIVDGNNTTHGVVSDFSGQFFQAGDVAVQFGEGGIPVGLGLAAAHSGAASAFGVVGAFGHAEFRLALASALEQATSDGFDLDDLDSRATGLMFWLSISARALRQQVIEPLWQSLGTPLGDLLGEGRLTRIEIPSEFADQFWSQVGQTLTGVPSGIYRLGNMLESVLPTLVPRRIRSALPRSGDQGQPNSSPSSGVKTKRSSLERPRAMPPNGQVQPPSKPNATKDKSAQTPNSKKLDGQQASTSHTRWLWFNFKDEKSSTQPADRRGA